MVEINSSPSHHRSYRSRASELPKGVIIEGVSDLPPNVVVSRLKHYFRALRTGPYAISMLRSKRGFHFQHEHASAILSNAPNNLFGKYKTFSISMYEPAPRVFVPFIPSNLTNDDLLRHIPGSFMVKRFERSKSGFVFLLSEESQAILIRDGVTIKSRILEFELPFRSYCTSCFSLDHDSGDCGKPRACISCGNPSDHDECKLQCAYCGDLSHTIKQCPKLRNDRVELHARDTEQLLSSIPDYDQLDDGDEDPVHLMSHHQIRVIDNSGLNDEQMDGMSYADIVNARKRKTRRKSKARKSKANAPRINNGDFNAEDLLNRIDQLERVVEKLTSTISKLTEFIEATKPPNPPKSRKRTDRSSNEDGHFSESVYFEKNLLSVKCNECGGDFFYDEIAHHAKSCEKLEIALEDLAVDSNNTIMAEDLDEIKEIPNPDLVDSHIYEDRPPQEPPRRKKSKGSNHMDLQQPSIVEALKSPKSRKKPARKSSQAEREQ